MSKHRIELLDSFRFIALMSVLLYHFMTRWVALYPYGHFYGVLFSHGFLALNFYFMISGFVIHYTLENTSAPGIFVRNRISRLAPPMVLCSLITFFVVRLLDDHLYFPNAHPARNLLPGLTFVNPVIWSWLTGTKMEWISGSYWSLWTEIQFYLLAAGVYFANRKHFFRNIMVVGLVLSSMKYIPIYLVKTHRVLFFSYDWTHFLSGWKYIDEVFNICFFILWFLAGIVFYELYKGLSLSFKKPSGLMVVVLFVYIVAELRVFYAGSFYVNLPLFLIMLILFVLMIYRPDHLRWLKTPVIARIGLISYTIYLIHEDIGVLLINKYGGWLGSWSPLAPFIVILLFIGFAELSYRFYERKAGMLIKGKHVLK
jgi:peptidoglycan/LPS O-acetylase OafA/YrhL